MITARHAALVRFSSSIFTRNLSSRALYHSCVSLRCGKNSLSAATQQHSLCSAGRLLPICHRRLLSDKAAAGEGAAGKENIEPGSGSAISQARESKESALQAEEDLPPLAFEPGVVGTVQKGVSAVVIAFGAVAFGAIAFGVQQAFFPGAGSSQSVFSEAFEHVRINSEVGYALGTPVKGLGAGRRGSQPLMWEVEGEKGEPCLLVRFVVEGPQGFGTVTCQTPKDRKKGEFNYVIFEDAQTRHLTHVIDNRGMPATDGAAAESPPAPLTQQ